MHVYTHLYKKKHRIDKPEANEIGFLQKVVIMGCREREMEANGEGGREGHCSEYTFLYICVTNNQKANQ